MATLTASAAAVGCGSSDDGGGGSAATAKTTAAASCTPEHRFTTIKDGTLTVVGITYPPTSLVKDGKITGSYDGDLVAEFARRNCLKIKASPAELAGAVESIKSRRADVAMGGWYRSKDRAKVVDYSDPLYLDQMAVLSRNGVSDLTALKGKRVGDLQGAAWNKPMKAAIGSGYRLYQTIDQAQADVQAGRLDASIGSLLTLGPDQKAGKYKGLKAVPIQSDPAVSVTVTPAQCALLVTKGNAELEAALNATIAELKKNGTYAAIMKRYGLNPSVLDTGPARYS